RGRGDVHGARPHPRAGRPWRADRAGAPREPCRVRPGGAVDRRAAVRLQEPQFRVPRPNAAREGAAHDVPRRARGARGEGASVTRALLVLEDGSAFRGKAFGATGETFGEAVFNTAMSGYQEVLTDPSYAGQIVTMTYPHQGNYGVNGEDPESGRVQVAGFVVREASRRPSSWRSERSLAEELEAGGIVGIEGIDTRRLTLRIRESGA